MLPSLPWCLPGRRCQVLLWFSYPLVGSYPRLLYIHLVLNSWWVRQLTKQRCRDATSSPVLTFQANHSFIYIYIYIYNLVRVIEWLMPLKRKKWRTAPPKNCRLTVGQQSADSRPTVGRQSDNSRPTVGRLSFSSFYENLLPAVGRLLAVCRPHVGNLLAK